MNIGLNLLFLIPEKVGGTETYSRGLIDELEKIDKNNDYALFCNKENYGTFSYRLSKFRRILCPVTGSIRPLRIIWEQLVLPFQILIQKTEVLLSLGYICPLFLPCKSVVVIFDLNWFFHPEEFSFVARFFWKTLVTLSAQRADLIITSSENSKKEISWVLGVPLGKIKVVYGGIDTKRFRPIKDKKKILEIKKRYGVKKDFILTVSAAYRFKNLGRLIDAFKTVNETKPEVQLLIVGLGGRGKPELLAKIKNYKLSDRVIVAGWVPDEELPMLYSAAEVYVHPSLYEGFGFPVLEAMACGCPVISSSSASLPELVGKQGILINALEVEEISRAILKLLSDSKLKKSLTRGGIDQVRKFSWEKSATLMKSLLGRVCS